MSADWPIILAARLERGTIRLDANRLQRLLRRRRNCDLEIIIERKHATRSLAQNAFYWAVVIQHLSEYTGYLPDEVHELLKAKFLPKRLAVTDGNGEVKDEFVIGGTTTRLNKLEFGEFIANIQQWAAEALGVVIPDPDNALDDRRGRLIKTHERARV